MFSLIIFSVCAIVTVQTPDFYGGMAMIIHSDWHIHCEASYDSTLPLDEIAAAAETYGFTKMGITDHVNYNDEKF